MAAALVTAEGEVLSRAAAPTPQGDDPEEVLERIVGVTGDAIGGGDGPPTGDPGSSCAGSGAAGR